MADNNEEKKAFAIEELVKIGDHIHKCKSAIIITDEPLVDGEHEVLVTVCGEPKDILILLVETMRQHKHLEQLICDAFATFQYNKINNIITGRAN